MKKNWYLKFLTCGVLFIAAVHVARGQDGQATQLRSVTSLPATCTAGTDSTSADAVVMSQVIYMCIATNTWTRVGRLSIDSGRTSTSRFDAIDHWIDVTAMGGALWGFNNAPKGNWATTSRGSTTVRLSTNNGGVFTFHDGNGIMIYGAGATNTLAALNAPAITPGTEAGMTGDGLFVAIPASGTGSSTYVYTVVARDLMGGLTRASGQTSITTGQASLGMTSANLSSITRSNNSLTVVTSSANLLNQGSTIHIILSSGCNSYNGWYTVSSITNSTTFVVNGTPTDARAQGWNSGDCASTNVAGVVDYYIVNHVQITAVAKAWEYYVCAKRPGDAALKLIGVTKPSGLLNGHIDVTFNDLGSPFMDGQTFPAWLSNSACTAASGTNDMYTGVVKSGGGTTSLVVSPAPTQGVSGGFTVVDNGPILQNALNTATYGNNNFIRNSPVYIPGFNTPPVSNALYFNIYSPVLMPQKAVVVQDGWVLTNEPIIFQGSDTWEGDAGPGAGAMQFGWGNYPQVYEATDEPAFYFDGPSNTVRYVFLLNQNTNGGTLAVADNADFTAWDHVNFGPSGSNSDYLGMALILRTTSGTVTPISMSHIAFSSGPDQVTDKSWTPNLWIEGASNCNGGIYLTMDHVSWSRRSLYTGSEVSNTCPGGLGLLDVNWSYEQGGITPWFTAVDSTGGGPARLQNVNLDTEANPIIACLDIVTTDQVCYNWTIDMMPQAGVNQTVFTGTRPAGARVSGFTAGGITEVYKLPNRNGSYEGNVTAVFAPFDTGGSALPTWNDSVQLYQEPVEITNGSGLIFPISQPSKLSATAASGGSIPAGNYYYCISAVGPDLGESICSLPSSKITTTVGRDQTVNLRWTNPLGSQSSNIYRCSLGATCLNGSIVNPYVNWTRVALRVAGTSYSDRAASGTATHTPMLTGTGQASINKNIAWAPVFLHLPQLVSALPACSASTEGELATVIDSTTTTWGAMIAGKGSSVVLAFCDGTNWTVAGR